MSGVMMEVNKVKYEVNFALVPYWVYDISSDLELKTYIALAKYANNETKECWPSINTIGKQIKKGRVTTIKALKGLEEKGCITVKRRKKTNKDNETNLYTLRINKPASLEKHTSPDIQEQPSASLEKHTQTIPNNNYTNNNYISDESLYDFQQYILKAVGINNPTENQTKHAFREAKQLKEAGFDPIDALLIAKNIGLSMGVSFITIGNINKFSYLKDGARTAKPKEIEQALTNNELQEWVDDN
jgi:DNA-binding transcriptional regulator YhcF (GntR family)